MEKKEKSIINELYIDIEHDLNTFSVTNLFMVLKNFFNNNNHWWSREENSEKRTPPADYDYVNETTWK